MKRINKSVARPLLLFIAGAAVYVYDGLEMNSWLVNLPKLIIFLVIIGALSWALNKKEKMAQKHNQEENNNQGKKI